MNYESYYITEKEFYLLLAGKGISRWYGLSMDPRGEITQNAKMEDLHRILASLYQKNLVSWNEGRVKMEPFAAEMMKILMVSTCCMHLTVEGTGEQIAFYFQGNMAVMVEISQTDLGSLRVSILSQRDVIEVCQDYSVFPEEDLFFDEEEETDYVEKGTAAIKKASMIFLHPRTGQELEKIDVSEDGIDTLLDIYRAGVHRKTYFSQEKWQVELLEMCTAHEEIR